MNLAQNKLVIIGVAAVVLVTVIIVVAVASKTSPDSGAGKLNKQCNRVSDPIDEIKISSCPNLEKDGHCKIDSTQDLHVEMSFTPSKWRHSSHHSLFPTKINLIYSLNQIDPFKLFSISTWTYGHKNREKYHVCNIFWVQHNRLLSELWCLPNWTLLGWTQLSD